MTLLKWFWCGTPVRRIFILFGETVAAVYGRIYIAYRSPESLPLVDFPSSFAVVHMCVVPFSTVHLSIQTVGCILIQTARRNEIFKHVLYVYRRSVLYI